MGDGVLGHVAEEDGPDCDSQLGGRELAVEVLQRLPDGAGLAVTAPDHGLDARAARRHKGEFRRDKEGIRHDEHDDREQAQTEAVHGLIVLDLRRGHIRAAC